MREGGGEVGVWGWWGWGNDEGDWGGDVIWGWKVGWRGGVYWGWGVGLKLLDGGCEREGGIVYKRVDGVVRCGVRLVVEDDVDGLREGKVVEVMCLLEGGGGGWVWWKSLSCWD